MFQLNVLMQLKSELNVIKCWNYVKMFELNDLNCEIVVK